MSWPTFFSTFLKDPYVAAVRPSSRFLADRVVRHLSSRDARTVVEFGPGDGAVTRPALDALPTDARYVAVERNAAFVRNLQGMRDARLAVIAGTAASPEVTEMIPAGSVDAVLASIPFAMLTAAERAEVMGAAARVLRPGGACIVFHQYTPVMRARMRRTFGNVRTGVEVRNMFPCLVFVSIKGKRGKGVKRSRG